MQSIPFVQTSVFVEDRYKFGGNQLATFWDASQNKVLSTEMMQGIALEMNFSECTFLEKPTVRGCHSKVRIFTPGRELQFAGHPTLGTAFVMRHRGLVDRLKNSVMVELGIGPIRVDYQKGDSLRMAQPSPSFMEAITDTSPIAEAIGLEPDDITDEYPTQVVSTGIPFLIVPIKSLSLVKAANPNPQRIIENLEHVSSSDILIFSTESVHSDSNVHARMFAPDVGALEDPATGSAAGPLGAYLEKYRVLKHHEFGQAIVVEQGYEIRRPSRLTVTVPHESMEEIFVSGKVRLVAEGTFYIE
jgi:trans-2,3-dihydro-3-hydroxyanthranilate isomerase